MSKVDPSGTPDFLAPAAQAERGRAARSRAAPRSAIGGAGEPPARSPFLSMSKTAPSRRAGLRAAAVALEREKAASVRAAAPQGERRSGRAASDVPFLVDVYKFPLK